MRGAVLLDTVGILATWDRSDQWHEAAESVFGTLLAANRVLVATTLIFYECGNAAARTPFRPRVDVLRRTMAREGRLIEPTTEDLDGAWAAYGRGEAGQAGIVDHVSFTVMRRLGLTQAFTNDAHFRAAGFETLF
jgi:predicted nucleic acid-binding protein